MANTTFQFKRGKKATLEAKLVGVNKPLVGEPIFETDTNKLKIGNGIDDYKDLPYISGSSSQSQILFYDTHFDFPNTGFSNILYVATNESRIFMWSVSGNCYEDYFGRVTRSTNIPPEINGGNASSF